MWGAVHLMLKCDGSIHWAFRTRAPANCDRLHAQRAIQQQQEADSAKKMGAKVLSLPSSNLPMLSHAEEVAAFVIEAAGSIDVKAAA